MKLHAFFEFLMTLNSRDFLFVFFVFMQLFGFTLFFIDKRKAISNKSRISERILLLFCFLAPVGSLIAIWCIKHKNRKLKFLFPAILLMLASMVICLFYLKWLLSNCCLGSLY